MCSLVSVIPYISVLEYQDGSCSEMWTASHKRIYTVAIFVFQFVLPMFVIAVAYCCIMYEFSFRKPRTLSSTTMSSSKETENKKVVKLLLIITITFAVCVLPYHTMGLLKEFYPHTFKYYNDILLACYLLLYINSCLNPIIYNVFNERFRETFKELFKTLVAYLCMRSSTGHGDQNFFSSRRASNLNFHDLHHRGSGNCVTPNGCHSGLACVSRVTRDMDTISEGMDEWTTQSSYVRSPFLINNTNTNYDHTVIRYSNGNCSIEKLQNKNNNIHDNENKNNKDIDDDYEDDSDIESIADDKSVNNQSKPREPFLAFEDK